MSIFQICQNWKLHVVIFVVTLISEAIGTIKIPVAFGFIMFLPLLYDMALVLILALVKPFTWVSSQDDAAANEFIVIGIAIFCAKVGINSGAAIQSVFAAGPALLLQEFGNLGTILLALPIALLLGFKREAVGMTNSIGREPNIALVADVYGIESPEGRGVMITYIVGTLIGTIFMGSMASLVATLTSIHPIACAMACGVGSGSMMAASLAPLLEAFPDMAQELTAYAGISNMLSTADGVFMTMFLGLPLCNFIYKHLEPIIGRTTKVSAPESNKEG